MNENDIKIPYGYEVPTDYLLLWDEPYDPAAPLRGGDPLMIDSGYDSLGRWWYGTPIALPESLFASTGKESGDG